MTSRTPVSGWFVVLLGAWSASVVTGCRGSATKSAVRVDDSAVSAVSVPAGGVSDFEIEGPGSAPGYGRRKAIKLSMTAARARRCAALRPLAVAAGRKHNIDPDMLLAIAWVESGFSNEAVSSVGAQGPMQLMPRTSTAFGCDEPAVPRCAMPAAAALYRRLLRRFRGRETYALCAYNAGSGRIRSAWRARKLPFNVWYAERVQAARARLKRSGCRTGA